MTRYPHREVSVLDDKRSFILDAVTLAKPDVVWAFGAVRRLVALTVVGL